ncbi:TPR-like protein [Rhizoctonia solani]|uniref:TPR-like protein n=1 Tax=Rhizoctonia solani TaxID=456999 RepID=A0A8H7HJ53_9AGAM|nr:TPR-like protein [Rhizoctonia solani]
MPVADLAKAIECHTRALDLTPDGHPDLPDRHASLGVSYTDRYEHTGEMADLFEAIECDTRALELIPDGHPDLSKRHFHWAYISHLRFRHTRDPSHLATSLQSFRKSSQLLTGPPRDVFDNAHRWATLASEHPYLSPIEAFRATIDLLPHYIWLGSTSTQRYHDLSMTENLAVRAASAAIQSSEYRLALEWLEHARCVVWNQSLMLCTPLDDLTVLHPDLASQLQQVSHELHQAGSGVSPSGTDPFAAHTPERRHHLAEEYAKLLEQVRQHRGFEHFLLPIKSDRLIRAARYGPVVVINCHEAHCDALFILPECDHVSHLSLPKFDQQKAQKTRSEIERLLRDKGIRERTYRIKFRRLGDTEPDAGPVLASLWHDVVRPVLAHLGYMNDHPSGTLPHITWCPTGIMSFLPLHAAGDYDQPRSRVFDYAISSYTPTLAALLGSGPRPLNQATKVLAIGQTNTPGCSSLPGTARELACLESHIRGKASYSQLVEDEATATTVLDAMEQHDWVHLACHAHQNLKDPTQSGFYLHGGILDLSAINQRTFRNKGLAFLSACQTATGDKELPDEAIHLASGMLMAGYPSVIATMWSVMDEDAPFVADKVYARLMQDGQVGSGEAGKALHDAVAGLREKVGEKEFARWVPYIHIGS